MIFLEICRIINFQNFLILYLGDHFHLIHVIQKEFEYGHPRINHAAPFLTFDIQSMENRITLLFNPV